MNRKETGDLSDPTEADSDDDGLTDGEEVLSGEWTYCAQEDEFCSFSGTKNVRYGINEIWYYEIKIDGDEYLILSESDIFGVVS